MAARGEQALALAGKIADGLMISNMCPPEFTRWAVEDHARGGACGGPAGSRRCRAICAMRGAARAGAGLHLAKETLGRDAAGVLVAGAAGAGGEGGLAAAPELSEADLPPRSSGCAPGSGPPDALDDRFVAAFAIAGTADDCLAQARRYRAAGASELALTFAGAQPETDMAYLMDAARAAAP